MKQATLIILILPFINFAQSVNGKIYDEDSTVKGALVINITQNDTTYTDTKGYFKLTAKINDSLMLKSLFHHTKAIKLKSIHFNNTTVFELKKKVNELNEVLLTNEEEKKFESIEYTSNVASAFKEDMKNNAHLYIPEESYSRGINFPKLAKLVGLNKLFKKKKTGIKHIKFNQVDSLFSNSKVFNDSLLINDLSISKEHKYLFFDYIEAKQLNSNLLDIKDNLILLDSIFNFKNDFLKILAETDSLNIPRNK